MLHPDMKWVRFFCLSIKINSQQQDLIIPLVQLHGFCFLYGLCAINCDACSQA